MTKSINLLVDKVQDFLNNTNKQLVIGQSTQPFISSRHSVDMATNGLERDVFLIVNNTNGNLYEYLYDYGKSFS